MMRPRLTLLPLTAEAFCRFGTVVAPRGPSRPANDARAQRFYGLAPLRHDDDATTPELSIYRVTPSTLPLALDYLERHPGSSQLFFPTAPSQARYAVVVAPSRADGSPDASGLIAFEGRAGQGVVYAPGTWHYPIVALDETADFLMLIFESGTARDCETAPIPPHELVEGR